MGLSNRTVLQKAEIALADLTTGGGILQPEQAKKFMRLLIKASVLLKQATVVPMAAPKQETSKIKLGSRILRPGHEAMPLPAEQRFKPTFSKTELDAKLFKGEVNISDESLEDSIERGELRQTLMEMISEAIARDMEDIVINGDSASQDPFLATMDGLLVQARSHVVDVAGQPLTKSVLNDVIKLMPSEYLRDKPSMRFLTSTNAEQDYRNFLADRFGALGDRLLEADTSAVYSGIPVQAVPLFPESLGTNKDQTAVLLCNPKNINVGIWRQIRIESERDISAGSLKIVATLRFDAKFAEETAAVKAIAVKV